MAPKISVIICSNNPRPHYLRRVLDALRTQTLPKEHWELLLIDNASKTPLAGDWDLCWHPNARHIHESTLGVAFARVRAIQEARSDLLVFFDDDNVPDANYLAAAKDISDKWPQLGAWGASIVPEFEIEPPEYLRPYLTLLALRDIKVPKWSNVSSSAEAEPWGAGMCLRRQPANSYIEIFQKSNLRLPSRTGNNLISGEDTEICMVVCSLGWGMGLFPELKITHLIPKERLDENYLVNLSQGISTSCHLVAYKWHNVEPAPVFGFFPALSQLRQILIRNRFERRIFLAGLRARLAARKMIAKALSQSSTPTILSKAPGPADEPRGFVERP